MLILKGMLMTGTVLLVSAAGAATLDFSPERITAKSAAVNRQGIDALVQLLETNSATEDDLNRERFLPNCDENNLRQTAVLLGEAEFRKNNEGEDVSTSAGIPKKIDAGLDQLHQEMIAYSIEIFSSTTKLLQAGPVIRAGNVEITCRRSKFRNGLVQSSAKATQTYVHVTPPPRY